MTMKFWRDAGSGKAAIRICSILLFVIFFLYVSSSLFYSNLTIVKEFRLNLLLFLLSVLNLSCCNLNIIVLTRLPSFAWHRVETIKLIVLTLLYIINWFRNPRSERSCSRTLSGKAYRIGKKQCRSHALRQSLQRSERSCSRTLSDNSKRSERSCSRTLSDNAKRPERSCSRTLSGEAKINVKQTLIRILQLQLIHL